MLTIGDNQVEEAFTFDLVGAHPCTIFHSGNEFYEDLMLRILTAASTHEITYHEIVQPPIPSTTWRSLATPEAMRRAGAEFGKRRFFTDMVQINRLVYIPALHGVIAEQYSEGCFSTWDPHLSSLIATVTGSARPVDNDDLAVIFGIKPDGSGALVRQVEGLKNDPPSSEAVEMLQIDQALPYISIHTDKNEELQFKAKVPVIRSKLHGHRGVKAYHPGFVEYIELDAPYYYYPVSCSTDAQARAVSAGFQRSISLNTPADPRLVIFSVLPGHGVVIAEKWQDDKAPFQLIWEYMDDGKIVIDNLIPQGPFRFRQVSADLAILDESEEPFSPGKR